MGPPGKRVDAVPAAAAQLDLPAVDQHPVPGHLDLTKPDLLHEGLDRPPIDAQLRFKAVKMRMLGIPLQRIDDRDRRGALRCHRSELDLGRRDGHHHPRGVDEAKMRRGIRRTGGKHRSKRHRQCRIPVVRVQIGPGVQAGQVRGRQREERHSPQDAADAMRHVVHPEVAAGIAGGEGRVMPVVRHRHREPGQATRRYPVRDVDLPTRETAVVFADKVAVDPHAAPAVDPVKANEDPLAREVGRNSDLPLVRILGVETDREPLHPRFAGNLDVRPPRGIGRAVPKARRGGQGELPCAGQRDGRIGHPRHRFRQRNNHGPRPSSFCGHRNHEHHEGEQEPPPLRTSGAERATGGPGRNSAFFIHGSLGRREIGRGSGLIRHPPPRNPGGGDGAPGITLVSHAVRSVGRRLPTSPFMLILPQAPPRVHGALRRNTCGLRAPASWAAIRHPPLISGRRTASSGSVPSTLLWICAQIHRRTALPPTAPS